MEHIGKYFPTAISGLIALQLNFYSSSEINSFYEECIKSNFYKNGSEFMIDLKSNLEKRAIKVMNTDKEDGNLVKKLLIIASNIGKDFSI